MSCYYLCIQNTLIPIELKKKHNNVFMSKLIRDIKICGEIVVERKYVGIYILLGTGDLRCSVIATVTQRLFL